MNLQNSREIIFEYAQLGENDRSILGDMIDAYTEILNGGDITSDQARRLRKEFVTYFFEIYKAVFFKTVDSIEQIPLQVYMFLLFGFIDEKMAGESNAALLAEMVEIIGVDRHSHIFTIYQWLMLIYDGQKETSINEFAVDYHLYLRGLRKNGEIDAHTEEVLINDPRKRVAFEIDNMFKTTDRMLLSQTTLFCPFFNSHGIYKPLNKALLRFDDIFDALSKIKEIDFSLFYRETLYVNQEAGIEKEYIQTEVLPDIILLPIVGDRGIMWQEITGARRNTPARFILPIFELDDLEKILLRMCAEYRWDICKRIQGAHWNDLTDRSLTSEYCDYLDGFRKNHDLTGEVREKIKASLIKNRQSYRSVFADEYTQYMLHEVNQNLKLNKVSRRILFLYCPFSAEYRKKLSTNPQYVKPIEIYTKNTMHSIHLCEVVFDRHKKAGHEITEEMIKYLDFLKM